MEGEAVGAACEHVGVCVCRARQESWGLMSHPFEEWEQLSVNILVGH